MVRTRTLSIIAGGIAALSIVGVAYWNIVGDAPSSLQARQVAGQPDRATRTDDGGWRVLAIEVTTVDSATELAIPRVQRGWQVVRVVAPADGVHQRGVSERLRLFGY